MTGVQTCALPIWTQWIFTQLYKHDLAYQKEQTTQTQYISALHTKMDGTIEVRIQRVSQLGSNNTLTLRPFSDANMLVASNSSDFIRGSEKAVKSWRCGSSQDGTTIDARYLPASCKE